MKVKSHLWVILFISLFSGNLFAQMPNPVKWSWTVEKVNESEYDIVFKAKIQDKWSLYSQYIKEGGPVPTSFNFDEADNFKVSGKAKESDNVEEVNDKIFNMKIKKFHHDATFTQRIKVLDKSKPVSGYINFMTCDDTRCLPPSDVDFKLDFAAIDKGGAEKKNSSDNGQALDKGKDEKKPLSWTIDLEKINDKEYILKYTATINKGWNVYSIYTEDNGPVPTSVVYENMDGIELVGKAVEDGHVKKGKDKMFGVNVIKFLDDKPYSISQKIKIKDKTKPLSGFIEYQACDDEKCILLNKDFGFDLVNEKVLDKDKKEVGTAGNNKNIDAADLKDLNSGYSFDKEFISDDCDIDSLRKTEKEKGSSNWWVIFILGFGGGLLAFLTPCVFPMVPLTVSYFTKKSDTRAKGIRNALYYGFSIILIYVVMGLLVTGIFGAEALNQLSTNAWFNIFFAVLFIIFGISFFGFFEITLPSSWANKSDSMASKGGLLGIFFMAFTLALVSFSCTGPIIGTLLVETATGGGPTILGTIPAGPLFGMLGFSTALALPFALFAMFPAWLNSMPKSGSWMNVIKVTLGFIEIALALKFISIADLTMGWKILPYEVFAGAWVLIAIAMALYYFGLLRFPLDPPKQKISMVRKVFGVFWIVLALYIATGFRVSERSETFITPNLLSGLAPPAGHSWILPKECPLNINCFHDFESGVEYAKEVNKPMLLDFTGYGCVNCRRMEDNVWSDDEVFKIINEEYVLVSLYVDDRKKLDKPYISKFSNKKIRTVGNKLAEFQAVNFDRISQPFYVLVSPDGKVLNKPVAYTPDVETYKAFLECGLARFKTLK